MKGGTLGQVAGIVVLVGALNWGLVGLLNFNLVTTLFGAFANYVYDLVGLAALYVAYEMFVAKK